ncbi:MAG: S-formylglutathione hydrolase [Candidatus Promineifilaceae bacterium]|jgi:S-formylglutathione hydrolase
MTQTNLNQVSRTKSFDGWLEVYTHDSAACACPMTFAVYLPPQAENGAVPVLYWLSGLTCTHENFVTKAGAMGYAAKHGLMLIIPDTSPRGAGIDGEDDSWDFGTGAGFYLNATQEPWSVHYNMYDYITEELTEIIRENFPGVPGQEGIFGHSMGGHGALTIALKSPGRFKSVSAFAPICAPSQCPWGEKAFSNYLGDDRDSWLNYDANHLVQQATEQLPMLIDQGDADGFLPTQLHFQTFVDTCKQAGYPVTANLRPGYDHSFYFIASFIGDHIAHHAAALKS